MPFGSFTGSATYAYAVVFRPLDCHFLRRVEGTFEEFNSANWLQYVLPATQFANTGMWRYEFPLIERGYYNVVIKRSSGNPITAALTNDYIITSGYESFDGIDMVGAGNVRLAHNRLHGGSDAQLLLTANGNTPALKLFSEIQGLAAFDAEFNGTTSAMEGIAFKATANADGYGMFVSGGQVDIHGNLNGSVDSVIDSVNALESVVEPGVNGNPTKPDVTLKDCMRVILAFMFGKTSGGKTKNLTFRDIYDRMDRVLMEVDNEADRVDVTLDTTDP